jgi:hypothetical protein
MIFVNFSLYFTYGTLQCRSHWAWLEIYPQHVYPNSEGEKEEVAVGVAQNYNTIQYNSTAPMSWPGAFGLESCNPAGYPVPGTRPDPEHGSGSRLAGSGRVPGIKKKSVRFRV